MASSREDEARMEYLAEEPVYREKVQLMETGKNATYKIELPLPASQQAARVYDLAAKVLSRFNEKNRDYGDTSYALGVKGQYADMHRKMGKLKRGLWDGLELQQEGSEEILADLVGHALLTLDFLSFDGCFLSSEGEEPIA